jgi:hypothetical protein
MFRSSKTPSNQKGSPGGRSVCWCIVSLTISIWFGALYYFHQRNAVYNSQVVPAATSKQPQPLIGGKTSSSENMLRFQPSIPAISSQTNTQNSNSPSNSISSSSSTSTTDTNNNNNDEATMHIVFSTDCSFFQDWQTLLVFHSAMTIKQPGKITRIASGCDEMKQKELTTLYTKLFPQYHVHFTPDFKMDAKTKKKYDFYNKPFGLHHWLLNAQPSIPDGEIIILLDPDMILLRPFTLNIGEDPGRLFLSSFQIEKEPLPKQIGKGFPVAELYGLGAPWTQDIKHNRNFNRTDICGSNSPCTKVTTKYGEAHYR